MRSKKSRTSNPGVSHYSTVEALLVLGKGFCFFFILGTFPLKYFSYVRYFNIIVFPKYLKYQDVNFSDLFIFGASVLYLTLHHEDCRAGEFYYWMTRRLVIHVMGGRG